MKKQLLAVLALGVCVATPALADDVAGYSSNENYIKVGGTEYTGGDHGSSSIGSPGIGVHTSKTPFKIVSLGRLQTMAKFGLGGKYHRWGAKKGLTTIDEDHWLMPTSHNDFGHYAFKKVSTADTEVYFGEWTDENNINDGSHTVYYVGKDKSTNVPTSGSATYNVQGINDVRNSSFLNGTLEANFANSTLKGSLANNKFNLEIDSTIDAGTASFAGSATASGGSLTNSLSGESKGHFFGNRANALGGVATFETNNKYDTAFAGKKTN